MKLIIGNLYIYTANHNFFDKEIVKIIGTSTYFEGYKKITEIKYKVITSEHYKWREGLTYTRSKIYFKRVYSKFSSNNIQKIT